LKPKLLILTCPSNEPNTIGNFRTKFHHLEHKHKRTLQPHP
jgi:hypothetical protein